MVSEITNGAIVGLTASITVGPVAVLCIQRSLTRPRISSFISGLGVVFADTLMAALSYFLYSLIFHKIEEYKPILGVIGGIIVIIFGVFMFKRNVIKDLRKSKDNRNSLWQDFISVVGLTLSNFIGAMTYIFAFFAMFNVGVGNGVSDSSELITGILIMLGFVLGSFTWWTFLTMSLSFLRRKIRPRHLLIINRIGGSIIILLGIYTIISTFVEII
ncbi:MAG: LysE family transporter [Bacteroidales bacterium]|nr:LysE family transporter [Bacteroidales bacterium]